MTTERLSRNARAAHELLETHQDLPEVDGLRINDMRYSADVIVEVRGQAALAEWAERLGYGTVTLNDARSYIRATLTHTLANGVEVEFYAHLSHTEAHRLVDLTQLAAAPIQAPVAALRRAEEVSA